MADLKAILGQLTEKINASLKNDEPYEALQYIQSFLARKKKSLGQKNTSEFVFHGATLLANNGAPANAGTLLTWFIEDGAGVDYKFKLEKGALNDSNYCDVHRLEEFLSKLALENAAPIVDRIFNPTHVQIAQAKVPKSSDLAKRVEKLEASFAKICHGSQKWLYAFKSFARLGDMKKTAEVLNSWGGEGYSTEKPLFFARGLLQLLSDHKIHLASELLKHSAPNVKDNAAPGGGADSPHLAVWHLAVIMTELAALPPMQRVDKGKLGGLLVQRYTPLLLKIDTRLVELTIKAANTCLGYQPPQEQQGPNPMAMLQGLLAGTAPPSEPPVSTKHGRNNRKR